MAANDYSINVTAKINVSQLKKQIKDSINETTISVSPKFAVSNIDDNSIKRIKNTIANYINTETISLENFSINEQKASESIQNIIQKLSKKLNLSVGIEFDGNKLQEFTENTKNIKNYLSDVNKGSKIKFDVDNESYKQFYSILKNIEEQEKKISKTTIQFLYNKQQIDELASIFYDLQGGIKNLDDGAIEVTFAPISKEYLSPIKTQVDDYFKENPVNLTISTTLKQMDLKDLSDELDKYYKSQTSLVADAVSVQKAEIVKQYIELKAQRSNDLINAQEYANKLKALVEDETNHGVLTYKGKTSEYEKILKDLYDTEASISKQKIDNAQNETNEKIRIKLEEANQSKDILNSTVEDVKQSSEEMKQNSDEIIAFSEKIGKIFEEYNSGASTLEETYIKLGDLFTNTINENLLPDDIISELKNQLQSFVDYEEELEKQESERIIAIKKAEIDAIVQQNQERLKQKKIDAENEAKQEAEELEKTKQRMQDFANSQKEISHQTTEAQVKDIRDRGQALLEFANESKEAASNAISEVESLENEAINSLMRIIQESNATDLYKQETDRLLTLYKQGTIDFQTFHTDIVEKMKQAQEDGLVSEDLINKTADKLHDLENIYQQSLDRKAEQQEKARQKEQEQENKAYEKRIAEERKQAEKLAKEVAKNNEDALKAKEQAWNKEAKDLQDKYNKELITTEEYVSKMQQLLPEAFENGYKNAETYANNLQKVQNEQDKTGESAKNLGNSLDNVFNSLMRYFGVTKIFSGIQSSFSKMVQEVRDLDTELTEFAKVSDLSSQETEQFIDNAYQLGESVAKTGTEVVTATTLFKKMGYTVDESMDFAKDALMWTNVADGMVSVEEAANMLISTMKAYGEEAISTTQIIDALNEVSNNYSTSSSALSNNLSTVAATLAASGTDLYQTIGLMTAGIEVMPDKASKVANGLKTISQRIRQIDGDTAEKLDEFLGAKGKSRFDETTGQLKSTYDILSEVSELWDTLTINERQYIGEVMAGKNQITVLNALMANFATAVDATGTAMNSAGSAAKENERVLESIQGHINAFKSAFSELSKDLIDSDLFKNIVDFGTSVLKWLDEIVEGKGDQLIDIISGIGVALASWKLTQLISNVGSLVGLLNPMSLAFAAVAASIGLATIKIADFAQRVREGNEQFKNLVEAGSKGLPTQAPELEKSIKRYEELYELLQKETDVEKRKKYSEELGQIQTGLKYIGIDIDLINGQYDEQLSKLKDILAYHKEIELYNKQQEFQEMSEEDIVGNMIRNNKRAFGLENDFLFNTPGEYNKKFEEVANTIYSLNIGGETLKSVIDDNSRSIKEKKEKLSEAYTEYQQEAVRLHGLSLTATDELQKQALLQKEEQMRAYAGIIDQFITSLGQQDQKYSEVIDAASVVVKDKLEKSGVDLKKLTVEQLESFKDAIKSDDLWKLDIPLDELGISFEQLKTILNDPDLKEGFLKLIGDEELKRKVEELAGSVDGLGETVETSLAGAMSMMDEYTSSLELLNQAHMEFVENGEISAETLKKVANAGLEAYLVMDEETKSLDVNADAFMQDNKSIEDNAIASYVAGQRTQFLADVKSIASDAAYNSRDAQQEEKKAVDDLTTALAGENEEAAMNVALQQAMNEAQKDGANLTGDQFQAIQNRVKNFVSETRAGIEALRTLFNTASTSSGRTATSHSVSHGSTGSGSSSSKSSTQREAEQAAKDAEKAWKNAFDVEYKILKTYLDAELISNEEYYDALEKLNKKYFENRVGYEEDFLKYQDEIIKGKQKLIDETFNRGESYLQHQLNMNKITEKQYLDYLESLYTAYYKDREELEEKLWKIEEERYKLEQQQLETTIGYAIDVIDEEIDKLKEKKKALEEVNEEMEEQLTLQQLEDSLEEAKNRKIKVYRKGEGFVYEQDLTAISTAQTALDKYKQEVDHKKRLSNIDEEIKKLEEYKKQWKNITENYKKNQDEMTAKSILGENAREQILRQEVDAVTKVNDRYNELKNTLISSNEEAAQNFEEYIGDKDTVGTVIYQIYNLRKEIEALQSKTVEVRVNTVTTTNGVVDSGGGYYDGDDDSGSGGSSGGSGGSGSSGYTLADVPPYGSEVYVKDKYANGWYGTGPYWVVGSYMNNGKPYVSLLAQESGKSLNSGESTGHWYLDEIEGYASGTLNTKSKVFKINENGLEAMVTPNGTVISAPSSGYGVIKNQYTEKLTDFAANPLQFLSQAFEGYSGNYQNNQSTNETININGDISLPNVDDGLSFIDSIKTLAIQYTTRRT